MIKTIKEATEDFIKSRLTDGRGYPPKKWFEAGIEFAQRWIPVEKELPPCSDTDILLKGTDDRGIEGIVDIGYMHDSPDNKPKLENFLSLGGVLIKVTHWRPIEYK